jgi:hypothetical protein
MSLQVFLGTLEHPLQGLIFALSTISLLS